MPPIGGKHISWLLTIPMNMAYSQRDETGRMWEIIGPLRFCHDTLEMTYDGNTDTNRIKYIRGQLEEGEEKGEDGLGYVHWQLLVSFFGQVSMHHIKTVVFDRDDVHCEPVKSMGADLTRAMEYVWKQDTAMMVARFEFGLKKLVGSGNHRSIEMAAQLVLEKKTKKQIAEAEPTLFMKFWKSIQVLDATLHPAPKRPRADINVIWIHGDTGTGKTVLLGELLKDFNGEDLQGDAYWVGDLPNGAKSMWWDGYSGNRTVVFDDFVDTCWPLEYLLRMLDGSPVRVPVKGASEPLHAVNFLFTARDTPDKYFQDARQWDAWKRRFYGNSQGQGQLRNLEIVHAADHWADHEFPESEL